MSLEFTGERVAPGQVDRDLWNEHIARYAFAQSLGPRRRTLDAGCGTGYGAAMLHREPSFTAAVDVSHEAVAFASQSYPAVRFVQASCTAIPFPDRSFELITSFEVIEHLADWRSFLGEMRRLVSDDGIFVVSTPNKLFYAETRSSAGPNPFHEHEFEFEEFRDALAAHFPYVSLLTEDHAQGVLFRPLYQSDSAVAAIEPAESGDTAANFFIAVCSPAPHAPPPAFVFMPGVANLLKERQDHILRLEAELGLKDSWLENAKRTHADLVRVHEEQTKELEERNLWAAALNDKVTAAGERIVELQHELVAQQTGYEAKIEELDGTLERLQAHLRATGAELDAKLMELAHCVDLLHQAEATVDERTRWAQSLNAERDHFAALLAQVQASRWIKVGRLVGLGPELHNR